MQKTTIPLSFFFIFFIESEIFVVHKLGTAIIYFLFLQSNRTKTTVFQQEGKKKKVIAIERINH